MKVLHQRRPAAGVLWRQHTAGFGGIRQLGSATHTAVITTSAKWTGQSGMPQWAFQWRGWRMVRSRVGNICTRSPRRSLALKIPLTSELRRGASLKRWLPRMRLPRPSWTWKQQFSSRVVQLPSRRSFHAEVSWRDLLSFDSSRVQLCSRDLLVTVLGLLWGDLQSNNATTYIDLHVLLAHACC